MSSWRQRHDGFFCGMKGEAGMAVLKGFSLFSGFDGGHLSPRAFS